MWCARVSLTVSSNFQKVFSPHIVVVVVVVVVIVVVVVVVVIVVVVVVFLLLVSRSYKFSLKKNETMSKPTCWKSAAEKS